MAREIRRAAILEALVTLGIDAPAASTVTISTNHIMVETVGSDGDGIYRMRRDIPIVDD